MAFILHYTRSKDPDSREWEGTMKNNTPRAFTNLHQFPGASKLILTLLLCFIPFSTSPAFELVLGTSQSGTFDHHTGRAICRILNSLTEDLECRVKPADDAGHADAAVHNLTNIRSGSLDLGIVDSTNHANAVHQSGQFEFLDIRYDNLRSLFSLNNTPFTLIAYQGSGIRDFEDLRGKIVNIGNQGSSQREIMNSLLAAKNWSKKTFKLVEQMPAAQSQDSMALCHRNVDAIVRVNVHPDASIQQVVKLCNAVLISVSGPDIMQFIKQNPAYQTIDIPGGTYASNTAPVATFGVKATLITSEEMDEELVYIIVRTLFENLDRLKRTHPSFAFLTPARMYADSLTAPLHRGAIKYYREKGWIQ
jgi:TRAP transporter TAXI family solute receptor